MSFSKKEVLEIPELSSANEMLGWLITQWRETARTTRGLIILDRDDLKQIIQAYDSMEEKLCQNERPESKESEVSTNDSDL